MKILILNPPHIEGTLYMKEVGRCGRKSISGEYWPQTGLAYLAAIAEKEGAEVRLWDGMLPNQGLIALKTSIHNNTPDVIIALTSTPTSSNDLQVAQELKKVNRNIQIGLVGTHSSVYPMEMLQAYLDNSINMNSSNRISIIDFVLLNEAEQTLAQMIAIWKDQFSRWKQVSREKHVKSIAFLLEEELYLNSELNITGNLNDLPLPARHLMRVKSYTMPFFDEPFVTIIPSRGCPFPCIFCRAGKVWGKKVRMRSVDSVINEMEHVYSEFGITNFVFMADSFTFSSEWVIKFCEALLDKKFGFKWICNSRVDAVNDEMLSFMKRAGCQLISYGVESSDPEILENAGKKTTPRQIIDAFRMTRRAKILSFAYFILGLPGESIQTIKKSIAFSKKLGADYVNFHIATPFPGTEFYQFAKAHELLTTTDWSQYEEEGCAVISYPELTKDQLIAWQKKAMKSFYLRPLRLLRELFRLRSFSELLTKLKAARKMLKM